MLETRIAELMSQLDASRAHATQLGQEKDMLIKSLDSARAEKNALDKNRLELNAMVVYLILFCLLCYLLYRVFTHDSLCI